MKVIRARVKFNGKIREKSIDYEKVYKLSKSQRDLEICRKHVALSLKVSINRVVSYWIGESDEQTTIKN